MPVTALVSAPQSLAALERMVIGAEADVLCSLRALDPAQALVSQDLRDKGLRTWADLMAYLAHKGIRVRMMFGDRDPLFSLDLHRRVWLNASGFADVIQGDAQIMCAQHGQLAGGFWNLALRRRLAQQIRSLNDLPPSKLTPVQRRALQGNLSLHPAHFHQQFAVVDSETCMIGGLGLGGENDVSVQIQDPNFSSALSADFASLWNRGVEAGATSLAQQNTHLDTSIRVQPSPDLRPLRTFTVPQGGWTNLAPLAHVSDHENALAKVMRDASSMILIQTQAFTCPRLAQTLAAQSVAKPDLNVVLLLSDTQEAGWAKGYGERLQAQLLNRLKTAFGDRIALLTGPSHGGSVIVTGDTAIIGSANLTRRSMRWDCETSALIRDSEFAKDLTSKLATAWGGFDTPPSSARDWFGGLLAPHSIQEGAHQRFLPDDMF